MLINTVDIFTGAAVNYTKQKDESGHLVCVISSMNKVDAIRTFNKISLKSIT